MKIVKVAAIVPSAGKGKRLKSHIEKPYIGLKDKPILAHTLTALSRNKNIHEIIVAVAKGKIGRIKGIIKQYRLDKVKFVVGGKERFDSVYNALKAIAPGIDYVLIHDGIRPFIADELIENLIVQVRKFKACILAVLVKPTLKIVDKKRFILSTADRTCYWEAQTPQIFERSLIENAYEKARKKNILATDDSSLVEKLGVKPKIVMGSYSNIKITTQEDLELARALICA